jgi:hypothetical protein
MRSYDGRANAVQLILRVRIDPSNPIISNRFSTFTKLSVRHNTRGTEWLGRGKMEGVLATSVTRGLLPSRVHRATILDMNGTLTNCCRLFSLRNRRRRETMPTFLFAQLLEYHVQLPRYVSCWMFPRFPSSSGVKPSAVL